ncbi:biotin-requiring enzyme [uncultured Veillonella sp.]|uniref:biotin-requiring enzyme n=1 Tax=uncultured Veillonella sp. TaxID=159268 RepID=UPI0025EF821B|nr:biotin-requiring enzyme [uncultured Veillonella sp.]
MKKYMKYTLMTMLATVMMAGFVFTASAAAVNQESVLTGKVVSTVAVGSAVKQGDVLVSIQSLTGPMPAARATVDGVVSSVSVHEGDQIKQAQVVAVVNGN